MDILNVIHLLLWKGLGCYQFSTVMTKATMNILVHVFLTHGGYLEVGLLGYRIGVHLT